MPPRTIVDPHWEPIPWAGKVHFTATQSHTLDQLVSELRVSRAWLLRVGASRVAAAGRRPAAAAAPRTLAGDTTFAPYDEGSAARAARRRLGEGRVDVAPRRADQRAAPRVPEPEGG